MAAIMTMSSQASQLPQVSHSFSNVSKLYEGAVFEPMLELIQRDG